MKFRVVETLPLQIRTTRIHLPMFQRIRNAADGWGPISIKPGRTGMWTSTYTPEAESVSDWVRWCEAEDFRAWECRFGYIYKVAPALRIIEIDSAEDLAALNDEFGICDPVSVECSHLYPGHRIRRYPNWERLARHYDAIHLTEQGQWATRFSEPDDLYGWDTESTLWLRLHRNTLRFVKKIRPGLGGPRKTRRERREDAQIRNYRLRETMEQMKELLERQPQ